MSVLVFRFSRFDPVEMIMILSGIGLVTLLTLV
jgi:hypothetical protein